MDNGPSRVYRNGILQGFSCTYKLENSIPNNYFKKKVLSLLSGLPDCEKSLPIIKNLLDHVVRSFGNCCA